MAQYLAVAALALVLGLIFLLLLAVVSGSRAQALGATLVLNERSANRRRDELQRRGRRAPEIPRRASQRPAFSRRRSPFGPDGRSGSPPAG